MAEKNGSAEPLDLSIFDDAVQRQETGILVPIKDMTGKKSLGFSIRVAGPDSVRSQVALDQLQNDLVEEGSLEAPKPSETAARRLRYFAKVTMDFVLDVGAAPIMIDGVPLKYSEDAAVQLYQRFRFILQQVQAKADTRSAFL